MKSMGGRRGLLGGVLILGSLWGAARACEVESGLDLAYRADQGGRGEFWVQVSCAPGETPYRLRLVGNMQTVSPSGDLPVRLRGQSGADGLDVTVIHIGPTLGGLVTGGAALSGSRNFSFRVQAAAGQWVPAGTYQLPFTVVLEPAEGL